MYFRIDSDQIEHTRIVYKFIDFLGDMGGITEILVCGILWVVGGYLNFNSSIEIMSSMYDESHVGKHYQHEGGNNKNLEDVESIDVEIKDDGKDDNEID